MYDAIVVGARCAGASVARLFAQKGYRVLMVDKAQFPSDTGQQHRDYVKMLGGRMPPDRELKGTSAGGINPPGVRQDRRNRSEYLHR